MIRDGLLTLTQKRQDVEARSVRSFRNCAGKVFNGQGASQRRYAENVSNESVYFCLPFSAQTETNILRSIMEVTNRQRPITSLEFRREEISSLRTHFESAGWCLANLPDPHAVKGIRDKLEIKLKTITNLSEITLETYHNFVSDQQHEDIQWALINHLWDMDVGTIIGNSQLLLFQELISLDLHIQYRPYLRIARPERRNDNIGFHRDTSYGQSVYEITVFIPLTNLDAKAALMLGSGTHLWPESELKIRKEGHSGWEKHSRKHLMGFPYSFKTITRDLRDILVPVPITIGQTLIFNPAVIHGQEVNRSGKTRMAFDLRIVNSYAPIVIRTDDDSRGYRPLCQSPVEKVAQAYLAKNV